MTNLCDMHPSALEYKALQEKFDRRVSELQGEVTASEIILDEVLSLFQLAEKQVLPFADNPAHEKEVFASVPAACESFKAKAKAFLQETIDFQDHVKKDSGWLRKPGEGHEESTQAIHFQKMQLSYKDLKAKQHLLQSYTNHVEMHMVTVSTLLVSLEEELPAQKEECTHENLANVRKCVNAMHTLAHSVVEQPDIW